jgi:hypothetical protein
VSPPNPKMKAKFGSSRNSLGQLNMVFGAPNVLKREMDVYCSIGPQNSEDYKVRPIDFNRTQTPSDRNFSGYLAKLAPP